MATYLTWEDLDDEAPVSMPPRLPGLAPGGAPGDGGVADAIERLGAPTELVDLLRRKEQLESQLRQFAGTETTPEDARRAKCFPVKVHTKDSRIEDRRLQRRDEQLARIARCSLERAHRERLRAEEERQARLRQLESLRLARLEAEERQRLRRRVLEDATLARRRTAEEEEARERARQDGERLRRAELLAAARREQQVAEDARLAEERCELIARWETDLKAAMARARQQRLQHETALEREADGRRRALARRAVEARAARADGERAELAQRANESQLRLERSAKDRAEQRAFEARRDEASRLSQRRAADVPRQRQGSALPAPRAR